MAHPRKMTPRRASATQVHAAYAFPAPMKGLNLSEPLPGGDPLTALRLENLIPSELGVSLRAGYRRWVSNLGGEVRTLMPYKPASGDQKLFAAAGDGEVYDVTVAEPSTVTPTPVLAIPGGTRLGDCSSTNFTTDAGVHVLAMVSHGAGYWVYNGTAWVAIAAGTGPDQIDGVDPAVFSFVTIWKGRLWFIEAGTTRAWYLPGGVYFGQAKAFDFGPFFKEGGSLAGLTNWTIDGGDGLDDQLVVISSEGDVLIYRGTDPDTAATFAQVGRWNIGRVPKGSRFFGQYGSDVAIVCEKGLTFTTEIMRGEGFFVEPTAARAINSALARQFVERPDAYYWEVRLLPSVQLLVINVPTLTTGFETQWAYEVNDRAFATLTGLPMHTVTAFDGNVFFGDLQGNIWQGFYGESDGEVDGAPGRDLEGNVVTSFSPLGDPVQVKRFLMVRPSFVAPQKPGYTAVLNPEWRVALPPGAPTYAPIGESLWGTAKWGQSVWPGAPKSYESWLGAVGQGRYGSLAMRVRGASGTIFAGWQALVEAGGVL